MCQNKREIRVAPLTEKRDSKVMIAHCVVGSAYETEIYKRIQGKHPIYRAQRYEKLDIWRQRVENLTDHKVDIFLSLELRRMPRRSDFMNDKLQVANNFEKFELNYFKKLSSIYGNDPSKWVWDQINPDLLEPAIAYLHPRRVLLYNSTPMCVRNECLCHSLPNMNPAFWEQMAKNAACLREIESVERDRGIQYKWISRTRTDGDYIEPSRMLKAVRASTPPTVWVGQSMGHCHGGGDWAVVTPRSLAKYYFDFATHVNCSWLHRLRGSKCEWVVENSLWQWMTSQHVNVNIL